MFNETRSQLQILGLPKGDYFHMPSSTKKFADGSDFRIEVPTINSFEAMISLLDESEKLNIKINRVTETLGIFRHTKDEIKQMVNLCEEYSCELMMSVGPRASYDTSATANSPQGKTIAYRLRGQEQIIRAIEDIKRAMDLGVTAFLIYDEGLLWTLNEMRAQGFISKSIIFKISAHCGHGNPSSFKMLENIGANSINPARDLDLPMLSAIRATVDIPIDVHMDNPTNSGGFIRVYEAPEIVRLVAPVYLKTGNSVLSSHGCRTSALEGLLMARQASIVLEMIQKYYPIAKQSILMVNKKCAAFMDS